MNSPFPKIMIEIKPPQPLPNGPGLKIFLAGSIEMGLAIDWQTKVTSSIFDANVIVLNPRRDSWDSSWEQSITNPNFVGQVNWELDGLEMADIIVMYIDPSTKAPISLLEFGQYYQRGKLIIACPPGFWRKGNLEVCCARAEVMLLDNLEDLIKALKHSIEHLTYHPISFSLESSK